MLSPPPRSVLIVCTRRIGDVLLTTPLIRSLRRAWPQADIDALVFRGTEGALQGNPDLASVITVPPRSRWTTRLRELRSLWRHYDLAVSTLASDRARFYGWAAGARHLGVICKHESGSKARLFDDAIDFDDRDTHTVTMGLRLAELAGVAPYFEVVPPTAGGLLPIAVSTPFAVLHPFPKFNYKMWQENGWITLAKVLQARGYLVVLTGSNDPDEVACCTRIAKDSSALNMAGKLSLGQTGDLLRKARLFVGPDTAVTHIAAATGIPVLALFGPSNPVKWGPWPVAWVSRESPWALVGSQQQGNVSLLQGNGECVPCTYEGCDRHTESFSRCLQEMPIKRVVSAALKLLYSQYPNG